MAELAAGDEVFIPDRKEKLVVCADKKEHRFTVTLPKTKLRLVVADYDGKPYANKRFMAVVDEVRHKGSTDGSGELTLDLPPGAQRGELKVFTEARSDAFVLMPLEFGALDPEDELSGAQGRLANLGYDCAATGKRDARTSAAVRAFQEASGLPATGKLDDATRERLRTPS